MALIFKVMKPINKVCVKITNDPVYEQVNVNFVH